ncbi:tyrosine recombinase XerS [Oxobacter pfennigii]|uniref:Tyrosine recombinase XerS n=1 Tax=Oxobacter pfennigii TaxID=36849 RepID=A0A0P8WAT6_9CLOT|nr:tyrosine-type recombinase/integrase [Oxobacter pfennigii]KPU44836.1 tyrosine recombinase XerS [Oxobacter pfennigii]
MPSNITYQEELKHKQTLKLREQINMLPNFCKEFFIGIEPTTSILTRISYSYDLNMFFGYLVENHSYFSKKSVHEIILSDLELISSADIESFMEYLNFYVKPHKDNPEHTLEYSNDNKGKARKLACIRSFYKYFYKRQRIKVNPASFVDMPKITEKPIIRLEVDEVARLLDIVESGEELTETQLRYQKYTRARDIAILSLFLGTGIRVSELVGVNISDIDFNLNGFKITRKGGNQVILYFSNEVKSALENYINERKEITPIAGYEDALFLSLQRKRINVRSVQTLVKKYTSMVTNLKNISPHKLRSTYGTNLYRETGDIYIVADVLGHRDVNTTKKHYAAIDDEKRRMAAKIVKLRED